MVADQTICNDNIGLVITWLNERTRIEPGIRKNLWIALGDLVVRWPNTMQPWIENLYPSLCDPDVMIRKSAVVVLSHLTLNDMIKIRGHVNAFSRYLVDKNERVRDL